MDLKELITQLKRLRVQTGSLACLGCGHEHNCGVHGCAVLREAVSVLEKLAPKADLCCMCPGAICPGIPGTSHPEPSPCRMTCGEGIE